VKLSAEAVGTDAGLGCENGNGLFTAGDSGVLCFACCELCAQRECMRAKVTEKKKASRIGQQRNGHGELATGPVQE
jgi:hypothetical protein